MTSHPGCFPVQEWVVCVCYIWAVDASSPPLSLLGMFRTGGDLECRGERLSPHPHWFSKSHLYCGQPHKDVVGEGVQVFVFFFSSFPHLSSVARSPSQQRYSWFPVLHSPNMASHSPGLLLAKTGKFFAAREIESLKEACLEDLHFFFLPSPILLSVALKTPAICWA